MSSAGRDALVAMLSRLKSDLSRADLSKPSLVCQSLTSKYPLHGDYLAEVRRLCERGLEDGWLCPGAEADSRRARVAGASSWFPFAIEATLLAGEAKGHAAPKGEVELWWPLDGKPKYQGASDPGWIVLSPGSKRFPKATGGRLFMLSFLPEGAIRRGIERANGVRGKAATGRTSAKRKTTRPVRPAQSASAARS